MASFLPSRQGAEAALGRLRSCAPDAYIQRIQ